MKFGKYNRGPSDSVEAHRKREEIRYEVRRRILAENPDFPKAGNKSITIYRNQHPILYKKLFDSVKFGRINNIERTVVFDSLPTPRQGTSREPGEHARIIVNNAGLRASEREAAVLKILQEKWPAPIYRIENRTDKAGFDFHVIRVSDGVIVTKADAKPAPVVSARQRKEAQSSSIPHWLVGTTFKMLLDDSVMYVPTQFKVIA